MSVELPSVPPELLVAYVLGLLTGLPAPYWFAAERIKGFCRASLMKIPYRPPPGVDEEEAMEDATNDE